MQFQERCSLRLCVLVLSNIIMENGLQKAFCGAKITLNSEETLKKQFHRSISEAFLIRPERRRELKSGQSRLSRERSSDHLLISLVSR